MNAYVRQNTPVETRIMTPDAAETLGARALFGEKYGDEVRVVSMGERARQRHRRRRRDLLARALRRHPRRAHRRHRRLQARLRGRDRERRPPRRGADRRRRARPRRRRGGRARPRPRRCCAPAPRSCPTASAPCSTSARAQANEIADLRRRLALAGGPAEAKGPETVAGIPFLAQALTGVSGKDLRGLIDEHKARLGSGVILLVADTGDKAAVAAGVTDDLTGRVSAVDLVRVAAEALGGKGGGGRPDMAQAGGADPRRAPQAIAAARALLEA